MPIRYVNDYSAILEGSTWSNDSAPTVLTYSFSDVSQSFAGLPSYFQNMASSFQNFTSAQEITTRAALDAWSAVSGLTFIEVAAGEGDLAFGNYDIPGTTRAFGFYPTRSDRSVDASDLEYAGDVVIDIGTMGNMSFWIAVHEIGHALGLQHPHDNDIRLEPAYDNGTYTVMSYNAEYATRLGIFDVQAIQSLYGSSTFTPSATGGVQSFFVDARAQSTTQTWGNASSEILGSSVHDFINAGAGNDEVGGFAGNDRLDGGAGDDTLYGSDGDDSLYGGAGDDNLIGGSGADTYFGGAGDDYLNGGFFLGSRTDDWVSYEGIATGVTVDLDTDETSGINEQGIASGVDIGSDTIRYIPNVHGGRGADQLEGSIFDNHLNGSFGNDTLEGRRGDDTLEGGGGNDLAYGNQDNDLLLGDAGFDTLYGEDGNDTLLGGLHADSLFGGAGEDSLEGGDGFDRLHGDEGNDTLMTGASADRAYGGAGDDLIDGGRNFGLSVDGLFGEAGNDTIYGGVGFDLLDGGEGDDLLDGGHQADNLLGGAGADTMIGGLGLDRLFGGDGDDQGYGGSGRDGLFGEIGNDTLYGQDGNDRFFGGQGADLIFGGADNDTIYGGAGNDTVTGGTGNDLLQGNFNADTFVFEDGHGQDTISDFAATNPREQMDLSGVSAVVNLFDLLSNHATQNGDDVLIDTGGGNSILLQGVDLGDLDNSNFIF